MKPPALKIVPGEDPQPIEILEKAVVDLAKGMRALSSSRLKRNVLVAILRDQTGIGKRDIEAILTNLEHLEEICLKVKKQ